MYISKRTNYERYKVVVFFTLVGRIKCTNSVPATVTPHDGFHELFRFQYVSSNKFVIHFAKTRPFMLMGAGEITHNVFGAVGSSISTLSH